VTVTAVLSAGWLAVGVIVCEMWYYVCSLWQIPTDQTSRLGGDRRYMQKFLSIIDSKINSRVIDTTLKFTLSALWNLSGNVVDISRVKPPAATYCSCCVYLCSFVHLFVLFSHYLSLHRWLSARGILFWGFSVHACMHPSIHVWSCVESLWTHCLTNVLERDQGHSDPDLWRFNFKIL